MSTRRPCISVLSFSPIARDSRLQRQIVALAQGDQDVVVIGYGSLGAAATLPNVRMLPVATPTPSRLRSVAVLGSTLVGRVLPDAGYWAWNLANVDHREAKAALVSLRPDVVVANEWKALPVALAATQRYGGRVVADMHEYSPATWDHDPVRRQLFRPLIDHELRRAAPLLAGCVTVCQTIADRYQSEYGIRCGVVRNIPSTSEPAGFRATEPNKVRLIHHGVASRARQLHLMVKTVALCDSRYSLHFMLVDQEGYLPELRQLAERIAPGRVFFEPVVAPEQIVSTISRYDIGLFLLPPVTFSYHAALPNKFFEFLFAGLAVCVGPSPEMARIAEQYACGVVVQSFDPKDAAQRLNALSSAEIDEMKRHSIAACPELRPEREGEVMRKLVRDALSGAQSVAP